MNSKKILTTFCLVFILLAGGCVPGAPTEQPVPIFTALASETPTVTPALTPTRPAPLPKRLIPTLSSEQVERVFALLEDAACQLPCYLGIVPGETTFEQANATFEMLGARFLGAQAYPFEDEELFKYAYTLSIYDVSDQVSPHIALYISNEIVFRMEIYLVSQSSNRIFNKYWGKYSITKVLEEYGIPDAVYIYPGWDGGNDTSTIYQKQGIMIASLGNQSDDYLVCPGVQGNTTNTIFILLFAPDYGDMLTASSQFDGMTFSFQNSFLQMDTDGRVPIDAELGIGPEEFYERMMADPDACFERVSVKP